MSYQPRSTNPYIMEKKLNECIGGGGIDPSAISELQAEIDVLGSQNSVMDQDIIDIKGSLNSLTAAYSTTEHKIGRKWVDGKDIYERTFEVGTIFADSWYTFANNETLKAETIINALFSNNGTNKGYESVNVNISGNDVRFKSSVGNSSTSITNYITIQYTKTV